MTFGATLRAMRLGFRELKGVGFVRVAASGPPWSVDVLPVTSEVRYVRCAGGEHCCWWEGDVAFLSTAIQAAKFDRGKPARLILDDDGKMVRVEYPEVKAKEGE